MAGTQLPDVPKGLEFEEFVASFLQQPARYVERQLREKEQREILEADVVLTDYTANGYMTHVVEAKSGDWGCADLFKLCGQMRYLDVSSGHLVALGDCPTAEREFLSSVARKLGVKTAWISASAQASQALKSLLAPGWTSDPGVSDLWRYSYWLDRCLQKRLSELAKSTPRKAPRVTQALHRDLQTNLFSRDLLSRTVGLYDAHRTASHLCARWSHESLQGDFDNPPSSQIPRSAFREVYYDKAEQPHDLDLVTWVEQRVRISILKNAVDYELARRAGEQDALGLATTLSNGETATLAEALPRSFHAGLDSLSSSPWIHLYPVVWQWFLWLCGGLVLLDYEEELYEWLGRHTGMPSDQIPTALSAFDQLFPTAGGWWRNLEPGSRIRLITLMPVAYQGVGANLYRLLFAKGADFDAFEVSGTYTRRDLTRWNDNLADRLLRSRGADAQRTTKTLGAASGAGTPTGGQALHIALTMEPTSAEPSSF